MNNSDWISLTNLIPKENEVVETKISDEKGTTNERDLKRMKTLWFYPDGKMYVYYTPTHWRPKKSW